MQCVTDDTPAVGGSQPCWQRRATRLPCFSLCLFAFLCVCLRHVCLAFPRERCFLPNLKKHTLVGFCERAFVKSIKARESVAAQSVWPVQEIAVINGEQVLFSAGHSSTRANCPKGHVRAALEARGRVAYVRLSPDRVAMCQEKGCSSLDCTITSRFTWWLKARCTSGAV